MTIRRIPQWVSRQAAENPDHIAVTGMPPARTEGSPAGGERRRETLTYAELDAASNRLARRLREGGLEPGDRVGLLVPKSCSAIVGLVGIYKADGIAVPLEPTGPAARLVKVLDAAEPQFMLGSSKTAAVLDETLESSPTLHRRIEVGTLDRDGIAGEHFSSAFCGAELERLPGDGLEARGESGDVAHLLFTSGSTGMPKGVMITHANVIHFVEWGVRYFGMSARDRVSGLSPLQFDLSTFDVFGAFAAGAELHLVPPELPLAPHELAKFIREHGLTQWFSVPTVLNYMARFDVVRHGDFPTLERLLWCGEVLPTTSLIYWMERLPHVRFTNLYGPTETTVASSYHTVERCPRDEQEAIPIGTGCDDEELLVLDANLEPVPRGEIGEICIRGAGLSPGYWRDPVKTRAAFPRDPSAPDPAARLYRTGDLGRQGDDGLVYFLGRSDSQVKSRGYRIELGEVEAALHAVSGVRECAVSAIETGGFEGALLCCAYSSAPGGELDPAAVRRELARTLPSYMLPMRWKSLERLPRNSNGKIDRKALREAFQQEVCDAAGAAGWRGGNGGDRAGDQVAAPGMTRS
ncbi:MAG TPA: amino acid adenylation domain-containing protein [Thermoanaerobaculia bacterium]|nr:amino acid adenylation domain-containing protein [Thermoanaerobaculia bacterium]